jgi:hypothetical protein
MEMVDAMVAKLGSGYTPVRADELVDLYAQSTAKKTPA